MKKIQLPLINGYCPYVPIRKESEILQQNGIKLYYSTPNLIKREVLDSSKIVT